MNEKEVHMKTIGLIVAVEIEPVLKKYGKPTLEKQEAGLTILTYKLKDKNVLNVVHCGVGEIAASAATQYAISVLGCDVIVNFGIVGGLTKEMLVSKLCIVEKIVHYDFDISADCDYVVGQYSKFGNEFIPATQELLNNALDIEPTLKKVVVASGDKFVAGKRKKHKLHKKFNADICEMEAAGIALTCIKNDVPFMMIKCVSDSLCEGIGEFMQNFLSTAETCLDLTDKIVNSLKD